MRTRRVHFIIAAACLLILAAGLVWPLAMMLARAFTADGLRFAKLAASNPAVIAGLVNAVLIALATTGLVIVIALPLAMLADRYKFPGRAVLTGLVLVPMILPPFVGAIGLGHILARYGGSLNLLLQYLHILGPDQHIDWFGQGRFVAIIILEALHLYPIMYLNLVAALSNIDPAMNEAAANLGAGPVRRFFRVSLPLMTPGLFAGGSIVLIWSFTELGTPLIFDFRQHIAVQIFDGLGQYETSPMPFVLVTVMLAVSLLIYGISRLVLGNRAGAAVSSKAAVAFAPRKLTGFAGIAAAVPFVLVTALAIVPHVGVVLTSFSADWFNTILPTGYTLDHYRDALGHDLALSSIGNSIRYAAMAMVVALAVGLAISWLLVRVRLPGKWLLDGLAMLPLAVPGLVMAFGYVAISAQAHGMIRTIDAAADPTFWQRAMRPALSLLDIEFNPLLLLVTAYAVRRLPYVVRACAAGLEQSPAALEEAAANLGAPPRTVIGRITVPLIAANLLAGALLTFSFTMLEVSDSLVLARKAGDYPLTKAIYEMFSRLGNGQYIASALGVWAMVLLIVTVLAASHLLGKRLGAVFRF